MYDFSQIDQIIKDVKEGVCSIEDGLYKSSKILNTWHYKTFDKYKKKGINRAQSMIIILGRQVSSRYIDPVINYYFRHALPTEVDIENMEDI